MRNSKIISLSVLLALVTVCIANNKQISCSENSVNNQSTIKSCDNSRESNEGDDAVPFCNLPPAR